MPTSQTDRRRWHLDYTDTSKYVSHLSQPQRPPSIRAAIEAHTSPPGFPATASARDATALLPTSSTPRSSPNSATPSADRNAIQAAYQGTWSTAFSPVRTLLTSAFALYMTGPSLHFFPVITTVTVLFMHLQSMFRFRDAFRPAMKAGVSIRQLLPQVIVHLFLVSLGVALGLYKADQLGFLPTTQSDWISFLPVRVVRVGYLRDSSFLSS